MTAPVQQNPEPGAWVGTLAWPQVAERIADGAVAVLPIGAGSKEHGPHLPLNSDQVEAEWLARHLICRHNVLVWPVITYGYYPVFADYPGSCSMAEDTFTRAVYDILQGIRASGAQRIVVLNTGISTIPPLQAALAKMPADVAISLFNAWSGQHFNRERRGVEEQDGGTHADEIETSIMLVIAPQAVHMDRAVTGIPQKQSGPLYRTDSRQANYCPSGVIGNAILADAAKGEKLAAAVLADLDSLLSVFTGSGNR